jgi:hypothetical protein
LAEEQWVTGECHAQGGRALLWVGRESGRGNGELVLGDLEPRRDACAGGRLRGVAVLVLIHAIDLTPDRAIARHVEVGARQIGGQSERCLGHTLVIGELGI